MEDEDAAAAAVRFCFDKGLTQPRQVLDIVGYLKGALEGKEHEPDNIELLRTAGAYSRRAAESSKEESFAEAAAGGGAAAAAVQRRRRPPRKSIADHCRMARRSAST